MEEIITVYGKQYRVDLNSPLTIEQRNEVIRQISTNPQTNGCSSCGGNINSNSLVSLAPAYSFVQGSVHQITITASVGIAPYTYSITMDTTAKATNVPFTGTSVTVPYTFSESAGLHTLKITVKDACGGSGTISNEDTSAITITAVPVLTTITVIGCTSSITNNATCQLSTTCLDQNSAAIACGTINWTSSNAAVASVSTSGLVTGHVVTTNTNVTITATGASGTPGTKVITVTPVPCTPPVCGFTIV